MELLITPITDYYQWLMTDVRDPRVDSYPLMESPFPTLLICLTYVFIVKKLGPAFMRNREPFQLRKTIVIYNGIQVLFSTWLFYEYGRGGWFHGYSFKCQPVDYSMSPMAQRMVHVCWWYYFSKFTEFFDTFFFVLRKKFNHVSTLHVIHHGIMPMSVWFGVKFTPGGHSTFFGLLNTFVHIIMYVYYMLAALGPEYQKYLWWKKHLTTVQIIQFIGIATHSFQLLFIECKYPKAFVWWIGCHGLLFLVLFSKFYRATYLANQKRLRAEKAEKERIRLELEEENNNLEKLKLSNSSEIISTQHDRQLDGRKRILKGH
ncbi:unnamed protein product [Orchesella dallaii]|uniref:Elongation of very long chain fatty acids protein n=1 Tax=Orchesella dallaii TaxID=48710 RepID=A0ABP1QR46_9HEXA